MAMKLILMEMQEIGIGRIGHEVSGPLLAASQDSSALTGSVVSCLFVSPFAFGCIVGGGVDECVGNVGGVGRRVAGKGGADPPIFVADRDLAYRNFLYSLEVSSFSSDTSKCSKDLVRSMGYTKEDWRLVVNECAIWHKMMWGRLICLPSIR
ncbi:hypothetical protein SESBI_29658 [Sesbania bispinosa]|nr:hypothetical protein SESBI_29658 [Sesbania bispinosa]